MKNLCMGIPNEKQKQFFLAETPFVAYGGARGGGKSWAVRKKAMLLALRYAGIKLLLLRRTYPELRENHILPFLKELQGIAFYKESQKAFTFINGSRLKFGYCDTEADVLQYQGQEFDIIFIDEATQFTEYQFNTLTACLRGANNFPKRFYLTCNPGGVGHAWVKRLFIDKSYTVTENAADYSFILAKVYDNKVLLEQDKNYLRMLNNLPQALKSAWLDGNWDVFAGQYFNEWNRELHVVQPFIIPENWRRYFSMDYGLDMLAGYFIAMSPEGRAYVYREIYESGLIISAAAAKIIQARQDEQIYSYIAPPDLWNRRQDSGKSAAEIFATAGIRLSRANNDRVMGWYNLKEWLAPILSEEGASASLQIFANCVNLIRTLPLLEYDKVIPNDVACEPHELTHAPDAIRYFLAGRPAPALPKPKELKPAFGAKRVSASKSLGLGDKLKIF
ncbi:MAG: phage terminase large subunit [Clostridia bacterium]|nr:phage terminase large subunit [Clostridia bacterium]